MQAVITSGGKQYTVAPGQMVKIEKLHQAVGGFVTFDRVLLLQDETSCQVGAPFVSGARVLAEIVSQDRHQKIRILKMKRRKHYMRHQGHRQAYTQVKITEITCEQGETT